MKIESDSSLEIATPFIAEAYIADGSYRHTNFTAVRIVRETKTTVVVVDATGKETTFSGRRPEAHRCATLNERGQKGHYSPQLWFNLDRVEIIIAENAKRRDTNRRATEAQRLIETFIKGQRNGYGDFCDEPDGSLLKALEAMAALIPANP